MKKNVVLNSFMVDKEYNSVLFFNLPGFSFTFSYSITVLYHAYLLGFYKNAGLIQRHSIYQLNFTELE